MEGDLRGQAEIWKYMFGHAYSMALKCAVELGIPDIINSHGCPITLSEIASRISGSPSPDIPRLARVMRLLVRRNVFSAHRPSDGREQLFGLTRSSRWLLQDAAGPTLAPMVLLVAHEWMMSPWGCLSEWVREGGSGFKRVHGTGSRGCTASQNGEFNATLNRGMECMAKTVVEAMIVGYGDGFRGLRSLVDVWGGTSGMLAEIVKLYPQIEGINLDLPHVIAAAPEYPGVAHVGGDMFERVPKADAVFMKRVLHLWGDEDCVKILKNCEKAIPKEIGKVIIVDIVLEAEGNGLFDDTAMIYDLLMLVHFSGGKERTENEWKSVLKEAGFSRYNSIKTASLLSIIEAYPD